MKPVSIIMSLLFCLMTPLSIAQSAPPAAQPDMAKLLENVNNVAKELQANLSDLETSIQESHNSMEKGAQVLDEMLASVTAVHKSMAEDSAIWKELDSLLELWEKRRKETLQKSESNPAFAPVAKAWEDKIKTAKDLRRQISTERANSVALMRSIESDRDIVLSYYELGQADKAIDGLKRVSTNLSNLNNNMQNIVKTASTVQQQQPIPQ